VPGLHSRPSCFAVTERDRAKAEFEKNAITVLHGTSPVFLWQ